MPRPKSYDREEAIAKACYAFWEHGFQALGVRELEQLTGINQFAIRSEFGGKEGLYLEALSYYAEAAISTPLAPLKTGTITHIIEFMESLVTEGSITSSKFGCLIVNTGIENARIKSPRLEQASSNYWQTLEDHFKQALDNEFLQRDDEQPEEVANLPAALVTAVMGIHARNRAQQNQTAGKPLVTLICTMLKDL